MKIFSWVQNKLTNKKPNPIQSNHHIQPPCKLEEFSDWPHGLLAIGTFGNKIKQEADDDDHKPNLIQEANFPSGTGLTPEEVGRLQKELNLIFDEHVDQHTSSTNDHLAEAEERNCSSCSDEAGSNNNHFQYHSSLVQSRAKDVYCSDNSKGSAIGKKSLSFLLKKMFVCTSGFSVAPSLRDPNPILESRMEKMLRTLLHKKIYPQSSTNPKLSSMKSLESGRHMIPKPKTDEKPDDGSKWVKTDSEYIVLEI